MIRGTLESVHGKCDGRSPCQSYDLKIYYCTSFIALLSQLYD